MTRQAKARRVKPGSGGAGCVADYSDSNITAAEPSISGTSDYNAGVLALEYHVAERDTYQLLDDLQAMEAAPQELDRLLRCRRVLTIQALQNRGVV